MSDFSPEYYCQRICPLFEQSQEQLPWRCLLDCQYSDDKVLMARPPKPLFRRAIPLYVYRDPREQFNSEPISPWQYGVLTGDGYLDSHFPAGRVPMPQYAEYSARELRGLYGGGGRAFY